MNRPIQNQNTKSNKLQQKTAPDSSTISCDSPDTRAEAQAMSAELRLISSFHILTINRVVLSVLLLLFECLRAAYGFRGSSSLYILLFANLAPWLLELALEPRLHLPDRPAVLPYLRRHYHYSSLRHVSNQITFWLTCLLLFLWERHNAVPDYPFAWLYHAPLYILCLLLILRTFGPPLLSLRIHRKLMQGKIGQS